MPVERTAIDGLLLVRWPLHADERGSFRQVHRTDELVAALGRAVTFVQGNHARSRPGVLRGFHAEPWDKLVTVVSGTARACVADLRPRSPTFGDVVSVDLGDPPGEPVALFVSEGLGNAYQVLGDRDVDYLYQVSAVWSPDVERVVVAWDDPDLAAPWAPGTPVLSDVDAAGVPLRAAFPDAAPRAEAT